MVQDLGPGNQVLENEVARLSSRAVASTDGTESVPEVDQRHVKGASRLTSERVHAEEAEELRRLLLSLLLVCSGDCWGCQCRHRWSGHEESGRWWSRSRGNRRTQSHSRRRQDAVSCR